MVAMGGSDTAITAKTLSADDDDIDVSAAFRVVPSKHKKVIHFLWGLLPHMHRQPRCPKVYYVSVQLWT